MANGDPLQASAESSLEAALAVGASRRRVLRGGLGAAASLFLPASLAGCGARDARGAASEATRTGFAPVPVAAGSGPEPAISADYRYEVLIPWGEPIVPSGPRYEPDGNSAAEQARQVGIGHDGMHLFPVAGRSDRGLLVVNHEFGRNTHVLGRSAPEDIEDVRRSQHAHGLSVVEIAYADERWQVVDSPNARRVHVNTPVVFSGPVAGHALLGDLETRPARGTLNNCSNGHTPWGTYLTCEENFHFYFAATGAFEPDARERRYGLSAEDSGYGWHRFDARFDLSDAAQRGEANRFGWVVEIDPRRPDSAPVKRTALGRLRHEAVAVTVADDGRLVAYMGDDTRFEYVYKFVSEGDWRSLAEAGESPLDHGRLYAARFDDDYTGEWLELSVEDSRLAGSFADQAEVLAYARLAAERLGATPMDRPEWTTVGPDGHVYCSLTKNRERTDEDADAANPLGPNRYGHIVRWREVGGPTGSRFEWEIFLLAQDTHARDDVFSNPDGLWADPHGRLFICTDGAQERGLNNQLLVADTRSGELRRLFTGVEGCEITGITATPDQRTLFVNVQHPGDGDPRLTSFPQSFDGETRPRDATVAITRKDGGIVGS